MWRLFDCESNKRIVENGQNDMNIERKQPAKTAITVFENSLVIQFSKRWLCQENLKSRSQQNGNDTNDGDRPSLPCTIRAKKKKMKKMKRLHPHFRPPHFPSKIRFLLRFSRLFAIPMNEIICSLNKRAQLTIPICFLLFFLVLYILVFGFIQSKWHVHIFFFFSTCNMQYAMCTVHDA